MIEAHASLNSRNKFPASDKEGELLGHTCIVIWNANNIRRIFLTNDFWCVARTAGILSKLHGNLCNTDAPSFQKLHDNRLQSVGFISNKTYNSHEQNSL